MKKGTEMVHCVAPVATKNRESKSHIHEDSLLLIKKEFSLKHISVLVVIFRTRLGHTTQIRYNLLHMLAFLYQKEKSK